jgi:HAE1 family hydrophobic/amphiphilic exporter-1
VNRVFIALALIGAFAPAPAAAQVPSPAPASPAPASTPAGTPPAGTPPQASPNPSAGSTAPPSSATPAGAVPSSQPAGNNVTTGGLPPPPPIPLLPSVPNVAPGYNAPAISAPSADLVGVAQQPFVGITLENAIGMALSHNPQLAVSQANRRIATYRIQAAQGTYDVRFAIGPEYQYSKQPPQNEFFAGPNFGPIVQQTAGLNASVSGTTQQGQQYDVSIQGSRILNNTTINTFNPTYPTIFSATFSQPLARNRSINEASRTLQLARINADTAGDTTLGDVSQTIAQVENAYWDLVSAWRNVAIQEDALRDAIAQQKSNERLARHGASAPIDVVQSNTQVNVFQDNVFSALEEVSALQNQLKSLVLSNPADPIWTANLVPTTPVSQLPAAPPLGQLLEEAMQQRPEIAQIRDASRSADVNLAYAKNELKPQIDLQLGYTDYGFAGVPTNVVIPGFPAPPIPPYLTGMRGQSITNLLDNRYPSYTAGFQYQLPLGNRTAKADYAIAQEQERSVAAQETSVQQRIVVEVRNALQSYRSAQYRLIAARAAREASEQVLASEQRRFKNGASTTFLVLQRQVELADNRGRELRAQTDLNKAVVELQLATGAIIRANNVDLTTVGEGALK